MRNRVPLVGAVGRGGNWPVMLETWLAENALLLAGFIATGGTALWRIQALEKRMEKQSENARADRRRIYEKQEIQALEMAALQGELRGRGVINGEKE